MRRDCLDFDPFFATTDQRPGSIAQPGSAKALKKILTRSSLAMAMSAIAVVNYTEKAVCFTVNSSGEEEVNVDREQ